MRYVKKYDISGVVIADTNSDEVITVDSAKSIDFPCIGVYSSTIKPVSNVSLKAIALLDLDSIGVSIQYDNISAVSNRDEYLHYDGNFNFRIGNSVYLNIGEIAIRALSGKTDLLVSQYFILDDKLHICVDMTFDYITYMVVRVLNKDKLQRISVKHDVLAS